MRISPKAAGIGAISLAIAGFLALMAIGLLNNTAVTGRSGITRVQKPAPDFTLPLVDGGELVLSQYRGRPVVINFWASWCPPCRREAPALERTWRTYRDDVLFVGVGIQDTEENAMSYLREYDISYPNGVDQGGIVTIDYGVVGIPVTFFVDSEGIVARRYVGAVNERQLVAWIEELVAGVAPSGDVDGENREDFFELD